MSPFITVKVCSGHIPITLYLMLGKVFAHVLLARAEPFFITKRILQQSRFSSGKSLSHTILALLPDVHRDFSQRLLIAHVDLKSTFNCINREALWRTVCGIGTLEKLLSIIPDFYCDTRSQALVLDRRSASSLTGTDIRQSCILALACPAEQWTEYYKRIPRYGV